MTTLNIDERLDQAMRATANSVEPPVAKLVDGGLARGRRKRRRRLVVATGGVLAATAMVAGGAVALPDLMSGSPDVVADAGDDAAAEGFEPKTAPDPTSGGEPLVIEDPSPGMSEDRLAALLEDVASLSGGSFESLPSGQSPTARIRLDFGNLGTGEVTASIGSLVSELDEPCDGIPDCEVLVESDGAILIDYGSVVAYETTRAGEFTNLLVRAGTTHEVPEGTTAADLGFDNANEIRDAILAVVPDAESADRSEYTAVELNDIVREVANLSTATSGEFVQPYDTSRSGRVALVGVAAFDVRASFDRQGNDLAVWTESCERGEGDGKPCTELLNTGEIGVFAATYPNQGNRESLRYVADLADGTLIIVLDNYMETASGKIVGSSLSDAGIDPNELVSVVAESGLLDE